LRECKAKTARNGHNCGGIRVERLTRLQVKAAVEKQNCGDRDGERKEKTAITLFKPVDVRSTAPDNVPSSNALMPLNQETAMGIVMGAATGKSIGWVTGSGLNGPSDAAPDVEQVTAQDDRLLCSDLILRTKSPRRRAVVKFTCNKCGERTARAINPDAYRTGTVFVQCGGCNVYHKLVDHLKLFHELKGPIFGAAYSTADKVYHEPYDVLGHDGDDDSGPVTDFPRF